MDISRINTELYKGLDATQDAQQAEAYRTAQSNKNIEAEASLVIDIDQAQLGALDSLKQTVVDQDTLDLNKVEKLKEAIRSGEFQPSNEDIVASMSLELVEFLVEQ